MSNSCFVLAASAALTSRPAKCTNEPTGNRRGIAPHQFCTNEPIAGLASFFTQQPDHNPQRGHQFPPIDSPSRAFSALLAKTLRERFSILPPSAHKLNPMGDLRRVRAALYSPPPNPEQKFIKKLTTRRAKVRLASNLASFFYQSNHVTRQPILPSGCASGC